MGCVDEDTDNEDDRIIMDLDNDSDDEDMNYITKNNTAKVSDEKTPLERYILKSEEKIDEQGSVIQQVRDKIEDIETKLERVKSNPLDGKICRICHLRLGHTSSNCELDKCSSVFKCGPEKITLANLNLRKCDCN